MDKCAFKGEKIGELAKSKFDRTILARLVISIKSIIVF